MPYAADRTNGYGYTSSDNGSNSGGGFSRNYTDDFADASKQRINESSANGDRQAAAYELAANNASNRSKGEAQFANNLSRNRQAEDFNYSMSAQDKTQNFKSGESQKDRDQRKQEFADNQFMQRTQMAQGRADLEYTTQQGQKNAGEREQALQRLRESELANATGLANINQQTEFAGQRSRVEQASLQAKAQVQAALFGSKPGYVGY
jgi:uncharacterized protein involved in exopolysaccharide biosynthesis